MTCSECLLGRAAGGEPCRYVFDKVFGMESQQEDVFETIGRTAIDQMRNGFNSTVMAYGQARDWGCGIRIAGACNPDASSRPAGGGKARSRCCG